MQVKFKRALSIGGVSYRMGQVADLSGQRDELLTDWFFSACVKDGAIAVLDQEKKVSPAPEVVIAPIEEVQEQQEEIEGADIAEEEKPKRGRPAKYKGER